MADLENRTDKGVAGAFAESLEYSLVQQPVLSLAQIADRVTGSALGLAKKAEFMDAPKPADFGSAEWHAQQLGSAVGTIAPFMLVHEGMSTRFGTPASHVAMDAARLSQAERIVTGASRIKMAAASGAVYSALFEPVSKEDNTSFGSFMSHKFKHAGTSAATFGALTAGSVGLNELGLGMAGRSQLMSTILRSDIAANAISGFGVGAAHAQMNSLIDGKGPASFKDTMASAYTFSMVGTALGAGNRLLHPTLGESNREALTEHEKTLTPNNRYLSDQIRPDGTREIVRLDGTRVLISQDGKVDITPPPQRGERAPQTVTDKPTKPSGWVEPKEPDFSHLPPNERPVNVGSKHGEQISREMSNFADTPFTLNGKTYASVEGFYVALKYSYDPVKAEQAAGMVGAQAKRFGKGSTATEATFDGKTFKLGSPEHHDVIKQAIQAKLEQHPDLARRFMETHPRPIIHDLGYPEPKSNLPAKDFARILKDLRTDLVNGKIKLSDSTPPTVQPKTLAEIFRGLEGTDASKWHPIPRYTEAFANSDRRATSVIKIGGDSIVLQLDNGNAFHVTNKTLTPELGTRPFDIPMVDRGALDSQGGYKIYYFEQPKAQTPVSEGAMRDFQKQIGKQGWMLSDRSQHQLGVHEGQVKLLDPFAVERIPFWKPE